MATRTVDAKAALERIGGALTFSSMLRAHRMGEEMSQPQFARVLGISKSHLSDIERGRKAVSADRAARFARALRMSEAQFVRLALQESIDRAGLRLKISASAAG
jgi:transcriptional regulator with XRE-family HTH domain